MGAKAPKIGDAGKAKAKKMNCKPGKSYQCGGACIKLSWNCKKTAGTKAKAKLGELQAANVAAGGGAGSASDVPAKQCNPKKSYLCGKSCIGLSKACKKDTSAKVKSLADEMAITNKVAGGGGAGGGAGASGSVKPASPGGGSASGAPSAKPDTKPGGSAGDRFGNSFSDAQLKETSKGRSSKELSNRLAEIDNPTNTLKAYAKDSKFSKTELYVANIYHAGAKVVEEKANRFIKQAPSITPDEAKAMAAYIGIGYSYQNRAFYDKSIESASSSFGGEAVSAVLAARGFDKLPKPSDDQIKNVDPNWQPNNTFSRGLTIKNKEDRDAFVSSFKKGGSYTSNSFMSTTTDSANNGFENKANVRILVTPKRNDDGSLNTSGKLVDFAKNKMNEREVLFSPLSKFNVADVVQNEDGGYEIYLDEA